MKQSSILKLTSLPSFRAALAKNQGYFMGRHCVTVQTLFRVMCAHK
ncbi:MAG: hypothetical protein PT958_06845 [Firmicutes bacterium]|nr:hypothetical protein [Bacillota bacterium]